MGDYFSSEEFRELLASYEEQMANGQSPYFDADEFVDIADNYISDNRTDDALIAIEQGLAIHPDNQDLYTVKSAAYISQKEFRKARALIEERGYDSNEIFYQEAQLVYAIDYDLDRAERMFRKWMRKEVDRTAAVDKPLVERDAYVHVISSYVELNEYALDEESETLEIIRKWVSEYLELFAPLGKYEHDITLMDICRASGLADLFIQGMTQVLEERPYLDHGWNMLALAYLTVEQYEQAIDACGFALAINENDYDALLSCAFAHRALRHFEEANECFGRYFTLAKKPDELHCIPYAECLIAVENKDLAICFLKRAEHVLGLSMPFDDDIYCSPERKAAIAQALIDAFGLYEQMSLFKDAELCAKRLLDFDSELDLYYFMLGNALMGQGRVDEALEQYEVAVQNSADRVKVLLDIGMVVLQFEYDSIAEELVQSVEPLVEEGGNMMHRQQLCLLKVMLYLKQGRSDEFMEAFKKAAAEYPDSVEVLFGPMFPDNLKVEEYYDYIVERFNNKTTE